MFLQDMDTYCLDARCYGNVARLINHLCEPNLTPVKVFVEHQDLRFPRICLFANKQINAYQELGYNLFSFVSISLRPHFSNKIKPHSNQDRYLNVIIQCNLNH